jgi:predicted ATPase
VRCGLHCGHDQRRDDDFYGPAVNRAARISDAANGGQVLLSSAVAERVRSTLLPGAGLRELGLVRLKDLSNPERIFQLTHPDLRAEFPALRSLESTPNNLPQQLNSFVGREREMTEVRAMLTQHRLVTLLAMGGVGKSRLSIQLGAEVLEDFPDGVWLVELAPIADVADVPQAVAAVLGVKEEAAEGLTAALTRFVSDRRLLLVIDNCEHVVRSVAELAKKLLQASATLKILASSRDPLQIAGEAVYHLPTLAVPAAGEVKPQQLQRHASVRLFLDRALAANPAFQWTDRHAAAVAELCRRLDGIPLALELAAARTRSLPVEVIAARLDERFRILTTRDRTVLPRQQTLRALIDWSFDLLGERERAAFRRLAVFSGGWTLSAAEAVIPGADRDAADVIDLLSSLVEKSLVLLDPAGGRYRMLDTVRHYADEKLRECGESTAIRLAHCRHYVDFAERARELLRGEERAQAIAQLDEERDNLLSALAIDASEEADPLALRMADALRYYLFTQGLPSIALRSAEALLTRPSLQPRTLARCKTLFAAGQITYFMGRHTQAIAHLTESLDIARELQDDFRITATLQPLGTACIGNADYAAAARYLDEAVERAGRLSAKHEHIAALNARAMLHRLVGERGEAERLYGQALDLAREVNDVESMSLLLLNLTIMQIHNRAPHAARAALAEAIANGIKAQSRPALQAAVDVAAGLAAAEGDWARAARLFAVAEAEAASTGLRRDPADDASLSPLLEATRNALGTGYETCAARGAEVGLDEAVAEISAWLGQASPETVTGR